MCSTTVRSLYRNEKEFLGKEVEVSGWVRKLRDQKNFGFIELNDGSFFKGIQVVYNSDLSNFEEISHLSISSSIKVKGIFKESEGKGQATEIIASEVTVILSLIHI